MIAVAITSGWRRIKWQFGAQFGRTRRWRPAGVGAPLGEQRKHVEDAHAAVAIEALWAGRYIVEKQDPHRTAAADGGGSVTVSAKRTGTFEAGSEAYPILEWSAKSHHQRAVPVADDTLAMLQRLQRKTGGPEYVFLSFNRLAAIQRHIHDGCLPAKFDLVKNLNRQFREIQVRARSVLTKRCQTKVEKIAWPYGCLHIPKRTWCTWTAEVVKVNTLQKWAGHQDIATTATYYCETTDDEVQRVRKALSMAAST